MARAEWCCWVVITGISHAAADTVAASTEIGASAVGESGGGPARGGGAVRVAGDLACGRVNETNVATGIDGRIESGAYGPLRGSHWLQVRYEPAGHDKQDAKDSDLDSWVTFRHRFDYEASAALGRRRDLVRGRYTGEHLQMDAVLLGDDSPKRGGAFLPLTWDVDLIADASDGIVAVHRFRAAAFRSWNDADGDGVAHIKEGLTVDSYMQDRDRQAIADTIIVYSERDRPWLGNRLRTDLRLGFATNTGSNSLAGEQFVNERHPSVTAGIADGALRLPLDRASIEARYDRSFYLTMDALLALEDRATTRATWSPGPLALEAEAFIARTRLWRDRDPAGESHRSDGVAVRARFARAGYVATGAVELGHSFYAAADAEAMTPARGARALVTLSRRFESD